MDRERVAEIRARERSSVEVRVSAAAEDVDLVDPPVEDQRDPKYNVNDLVCFEDTRVGEPSEVFWESLAVVKSRRRHDSQWPRHLDDLDYDRAYVYKDAPERRVMNSRFSSKRW